MKIISFLLDIEFKFDKTKEKNEQKCFDIIKNTLFNIYINSLIYLEQKSDYSIYPGDKIDIFFLWGDKTIFALKTKNKKENQL